MTARLRALPAEVLIEQSARVASLVMAHQCWRDAKRVSVYLSTSASELRTDALISAALQQGKAVFVPHCPTKDTMRMLRLRTDAELAALPINAWGIREHVVVDGLEEALDFRTSGLDLILAPGLAFDRQRNRLGHGRGYYDRYIQLATAHAQANGLPAPVVAALCLREQVLPAGQTLPFAAYDRKPDLIVTPDGIIDEHSSTLVEDAIK